MKSIWQRKLAMFLDVMDFCMKLLKAERKVNQQEGEEEFECCTIWQMMMALLHSNRQLRTDRYGDTEKGCQKPAVQQKTTDDDDDDDDDDDEVCSCFVAVTIARAIELKHSSSLISALAFETAQLYTNAGIE